MSEYTMESPASLARHLRRRRAAITIGVILLGMFFAFWYAFSYYEKDPSKAAAATPTASCRPADPKVPVPADITVNVYNATARAGLAGRTASALQDRGYRLGKVDNDPSDRPVPKVAEVRYGSKGKAKAKVLLEDMPEGTKSVRDGRKDSGVDIALGTDFKALAPATSGGTPTCPTPSPS